MQRKFILKLLIGVVAFSSSVFSVVLSPTQITNMVSEIKKERDGVSLLKLESTANPFIIKIPKKKELTELEKEVSVLAPLEIVYTLKAILNKAAFIDKKWYKHGDSIGNYKVGHISSTSVILKSANGSRTLSLEKKKKSFIKINRGYR